jgi:hypothetical protein
MKTTLGSQNFDLGFNSDQARDQLRRNAAYRLRDYIPQNEAPLRKRGGYGFGTDDLAGIVAGATFAAGVGWAPFVEDPYLLVVTDNGGVVRAPDPDPTSGVLIGTGGPTDMTHRPFWHSDRMILPASMRAGAANPKKIYSTGGITYAIADIAGTPPQARVGASWGDYLLLANGYVSGTLYTRRIWVSSPGNPDAWTTGAGGSWANAPGEVLRVVPMRDFILVFGYSDVWQLTGDTPPPGGDWAFDDLFVGNGTFDGRSITVYRDYALWANSTGVWKSDGATLTNLVEQGGISVYWRSLLKEFSWEQGWDAAAGMHNGEYYISIHDDSGTFVTTLICDIDRVVWREYTNIDAHMFAERSTGPGTADAIGAEELFFASNAAPRAGTMAQTWFPDATNASDADGTAVEPVLETPYYKVGSQALKRLSRVFMTYALENAGADPELFIDVVLDPWSTDYTELAPSFPVTPNGIDRLDAFISERALGVGFRVRQVGASADTRIAEIELAGHALEDSR